MKKLMLALGVLAALASGSAMAVDVELDTPTYPGSNLTTFTAEITPSTCQYDATDRNKGYAFDLGKHVQNTLNKEKTAGDTEFSFVFKDCPHEVTKGRTSLSMWVDTQYPDYIENAEKGLLKNFAKGDKAAKNVWVEISKADTPATPFKFGKDLETYDQTLPGNFENVEFKFVARLKSEGKATPGQVLAKAPFLVDYK